MSSEAGVRFGHRGDDLGGYEITGGAQFIGLGGMAFVDAYRQFPGLRRPTGLGVRVGIPARGWNYLQANGRMDFSSTSDVTYSWNSSLTFQGGRSGELMQGTSFGWTNVVGAVVKYRDGDVGVSAHLAANRTTGRSREPSIPANPCLTCNVERHFGPLVTATLGVAFSFSFWGLTDFRAVDSRRPRD